MGIRNAPTAITVIASAEDGQKCVVSLPYSPFFRLPVWYVGSEFMFTSIGRVMLARLAGRQQYRGTYFNASSKAKDQIKWTRLR
jgi:hypothetical protein